MSLLITVLLTEALVELVIKSIIFKPFRKKIKSISPWFKDLFSCGYCFSVWVAFGVVFILQLSYNFTGNHWVDLTIMALITHRLSNYLHNLVDKYSDKYYDPRFINSDHSEE